MTNYTPRRRGRPPANAGQANAVPDYSPSANMAADPPGTPHFDTPPQGSVVASATAGEDAAVTDGASPMRRRRRAKFGELALKLLAPAREGFRRRWFNDQGNRLVTADELGYDHVTDKGLKSSAPGSRISRLVGTKPNGEPLHAFLMETPDELYAEGEAEKEAVARTVDEAITRGEGTDDGQISQIPKDERYGHGSIRQDR